MTSLGSTLAPMTHLRRFVDWWAAELSDLLAARKTTTGAWRVLFLRREGGCDVFVQTRERIEQVGTPQTGSDELVAALRQRLGNQTPPPEQVVLRLQPGEVVRCQLSVPAGAQEVMEPVLRNQVERLAPWPVEKALLAYDIAGAGAEPGMLDVRLAITGRAMVEGLVAELEGLGYAPGVVDFGTEAEEPPRLNLLPRRQRNDATTGRRVLLVAAGLVGIALLAGAVGAFDLVQGMRELGALTARVDELNAKGKLDRDAEGFAQRQRRQAWLAGEKQTQPSMAIVLEALSRALPDDAWLTRLEAGEGSLTFAGNAANAAAIIGAIESSGHFGDVQFAAPTTRAEGDVYESFTITAKIVGGRELEP
jgi:general secretion pathway protein L